MTLSRSLQGAFPEADLARTIGVVASTPIVETLYVQLLTQAGLPGAVTLGLSGPIRASDRFACLLMVLDSSSKRDAIIARSAELKSKSAARVICIYEDDLTDVIRWSQNLEVFVFLKASAPFSVIASAVVLASYVNDYSGSVPASDPALSFAFFVDVIVVGHTPGHMFWLFWPVAGGSQAQARLMIFRPSETFRLSLPAGHSSYNWAAASSKRREVITSSVKADQGSFLKLLTFSCLQHPILCICNPIIANVGSP